MTIKFDSMSNYLWKKILEDKTRLIKKTYNNKEFVWNYNSIDELLDIILNCKGNYKYLNELGKKGLYCEDIEGFLLKYLEEYMNLYKSLYDKEYPKDLIKFYHDNKMMFHVRFKYKYDKMNTRGCKLTDVLAVSRYFF